MDMARGGQYLYCVFTPEKKAGIHVQGEAAGSRAIWEGWVGRGENARGA